MTVIHLIAGARPNFMKVAPVWHALKNAPWCKPMLIHTGQHYDSDMSDAFFADLGLPKPDHHLGVGSGTHAKQTASVMVAYETLCLKAPPDWSVVVGDVNSTMACTLAAKKLNLKVAHLEAGLRSGDRTMPEEINRVVTDALADLLWTPSPDADENLKREGVVGRIERVGNIMIDCLVMMRPKIEAAETARKLGLLAGSYGVVTLHRPSNVDDRTTMERLLEALAEVARKVPLVFPIHPRTRERLARFELMRTIESTRDLTLTAPLGYIEFMSLLSDAALAITDSGGIQEETSWLGIPCLTLRPTTERPITVTSGTNRLVKLADLPAAVEEALKAIRRTAPPIELWDGNAASRIVTSLHRASGNS